MCDRPNFEEMQRDMDEALISLFMQWHDFQGAWLEDEELQKIDCFEQFCHDMRQRLLDLKETPEVQAIIGTKL